MSTIKGLEKVSFKPRSSENISDSFCRKLLFKKLAHLKEGRVEIIDPLRGSTVFGQTGALLNAVVTIHRTSAYTRIALGGSIGTGESYMDQDWDCDNLTALIQIFVVNRELLMDIDGGLGALLSPLQKIAHRMRNNSIEGSRKNIHAHYDLGNDFFKLFLDETWMYSCGIFKEKSSTLLEASTEKIDRICKKLGLNSTHRVVEIGTGWGGFAIHAAKNYGCHITTTTISKEQYDLAVERVRQEGLSDRIEILLKDYRLLEGKYDRLVSIEMIEAVGLDHLGTYFKKCGELLKPEGQMVLQAITIRDQFYEHAKKNVDFIQQYIFPGSGIPSVNSISKAVMNQSDLQIDGLEDIGLNYATTLKCWSERLKANQDAVIKLGYSEEFYRMWQFYLSYCEGGFRERSISCVQMSLAKPRYNQE
jgi:cyclopropane-fatty-acyl-phospholipid synthase